MGMIPSFSKRLVRFRGPTSSHEQNTIMDEIFYDMVNLFNITAEHERQIEDAKEVYRIESYFQSMRNHRLMMELESLKAYYQERIAGSSAHRIMIPVHRIEKNMAVKVEERAHIDEYHGVITLPIVGNEVSKVYLYDEVYQEVIQSDKLDIKIDIDSNATYIYQNEPENMCNGDNAKYWKAKCVYTAAQAEEIPDKVTATITMHLPENIISNRQVNAITIHPFPHNTLTIEKVEYRLEGGWRLLPGWKVNRETNKPEPLHEAGNIKLVFPSMAVGEVRVTLTQPHPVVENNNTVFYLGMQEIGVVFTDYQSEIGHFEVPLRLRQEGDTRPKIITRVIPHFMNEDILSDKSEEKRELFSYTIYTVEPDETLAYTKETLPILVNRDRIVIKGQIRADKENKCSPTLQWLEVIYEDR